MSATQKTNTTDLSKTIDVFRVLVVDDNLMGQAIMCKILSPNPVDIGKASSAKEALEMLDVFDYSLILCDIEMPEMNGFEFVKHIRATDKYKYTEVVFLTAKTINDELYLKGMGAGAFDILSKEMAPLMLRTKMAAIINLLDNRRAELKLPVKETVKKGIEVTRVYEEASIMFVDFVGFTNLAKTYPVDQLVETLNAFYKKYDEIVKKHGLQKIKTIGDSYMCAGGVPVRNPTSCAQTILAAFEIQAFIQKTAREFTMKRKKPWYVKIGIATGEAAYAILSSEDKYDIWGNAVNLASRIESQASKNQVFICNTSAETAKALFQYNLHGKINLRNYGVEKVFEVKRLKKKYSKDEDGYIPNDKFYGKMHVLRSDV